MWDQADSGTDLTWEQALAWVEPPIFVDALESGDTSAWDYASL